MDEPGETVGVAARNLLKDREAARLMASLQEAGVGAILLKGASRRVWLYDRGEVRPYNDVDILIDPRQDAEAADVLRSLGYPEGVPLGRRLPDRVSDWVWPLGEAVDVHLRLPGVRADPVDAWLLLSSRAQTLAVEGVEVAVFDPAAAALHCTLHATQDGIAGARAMADLSRAVDRVDIAVWQEAADLAYRLRAEERMSAGLHLERRGPALAEAIGLPAVVSLDVALRATSAPSMAAGFVRLAETRGVRAKTRLIAGELFPERRELQRMHRFFERRGDAWLPLAYTWRVMSLPVRAVPALVAYAKMRRRVSPGSRVVNVAVVEPTRTTDRG